MAIKSGLHLDELATNEAILSSNQQQQQLVSSLEAPFVCDKVIGSAMAAIGESTPLYLRLGSRNQ